MEKIEILDNDLDINLYKNLYEDLIEFTEEELIEHYKNNGKVEDRISCFNDFYKKFPYFNIYLYKKLYDDLDHMSNIELYAHYIKYGKDENRISGYYDFYNEYKGFDLDFYKKLYLDIQNLSENELYIHYHKFGRLENRIINILQYENSISTFDLELFKKLNPSIILESKNKYFNFYINYKKNYFHYKIEDYCKSINNDHPYYEKIKNHYYFRKISNFKDLVEFNSNSNNEYIIYTKEDFYRYYNDFDYEYYKNRYFKNSNLSELEILSYYHSKGKYKREIINNKYKILIYSAPLDICCGGIIALHNLAKIINEFKHPKFYAKLFIYNNLRYQNIFCNNFSDFYEINDNTFVIYPETIIGNPLNCQNVIRWILLELGIEMSADHYKNWNQNDLVYNWESKENNKIKILRYHWVNPIFIDKNLIRYKTCYLLKKGSIIHKKRSDIHLFDSICLDTLNLDEIVNIFNESTHFYCYDPKTMFIIFSIFCGCIPIIYPIENMSKKEYIEESIFKTGKGIAYGNSKEEIKFAKKTLKEAKNEIKLLLEDDKITIKYFLDDLELYLNNKNSEKLIYCLDRFKYN